MICKDCDFSWLEEVDGKDCPICTENPTDFIHEEVEKFRCSAAQKKNEDKNVFTRGSHTTSKWYDWSR